MFSKSCKYAMRAVLFLALNASENSKSGVSQIAEELDVPKHFLAKILQQLSKNLLISSTKGPSGGFYLSEDNLKTSLRKVVETIDGPEVFNSCILGLPVCSSENPCPLHFKALEYRNGLLDVISDKSVEELAQRIKEKDLTI